MASGAAGRWRKPAQPFEPGRHRDGLDFGSSLRCMLTRALMRNGIFVPQAPGSYNIMMYLRIISRGRFPAPAP